VRGMSQQNLWLVVPALVSVPVSAAQFQGNEFRAERTAGIAAMLPEQPTGPGRPASDRAAWDALAADPGFGDVVRQAEDLLGEPMPEVSDDLFLDFSRTGNRRRWEDVEFRIRGRLGPLVIAECLENQGRFLPAIEEFVRRVCAERTWVMPAHDGSLANFNQERVDIDLASSALGWQLALTDWVLADTLSAEIRTLIDEQLQQRIFTPFINVTRGRQDMWWVTTTNNWNAVCAAGVVGAALVHLPSLTDRAYYVTVIDKTIEDFLSGFSEDGYCSEGVGYWAYGYGHFVLLAETVRQATGGAVDLFSKPRARAAAEFAAKIQIQPGVCPAFADCSVSARPPDTIVQFVDRVYGMGMFPELTALRRFQGDVATTLIDAFDNSATRTPQAETALGVGIRSYFDSAGILISRPVPGSPCELAVALKGGNNAEHHNHNDVGSYVVVVGQQPLLFDPGAEIYTARTFSAQRYDSKLLNSLGHPVPVIAGQLQRAGAQARGEVLRAEFSDAQDVFELNIASCYEVPELQSLTRTFVYSREGAGSLTVTDRVAYTSPQTFETALVSPSEPVREQTYTLLIAGTEGMVRVAIDAGGEEFDLVTEMLQDDSTHADKGTRTGIRLEQPVQQASVTVTIAPEPSRAGDAGGMLRNGGFEMGAYGWSIPADGLGAIADDQAFEGAHSLKITDADERRGTSIDSGRTAVGSGRKLALSGQVRHASGQGIGMYVRFLDADGGMLNQVEANGNMQPVGTLEGPVGEWSPFSYPFETPPGTEFIQVWIHSYNAAQVEAYIDDLRIEGAGA